MKGGCAMRRAFARVFIVLLLLLLASDGAFALSVSGWGEQVRGEGRDGKLDGKGFSVPRGKVGTIVSVECNGDGFWIEGALYREFVPATMAIGYELVPGDYMVFPNLRPEQIKAGVSVTVEWSDPSPATASWGVVETTPGMYLVELKGSELRVSKRNDNPGGLQNAGYRLQLTQPVEGDFSATVAFANARLAGGLNQVELQAVFADGTFFYVVRDRVGRGAHVWAPGIQGDAPGGSEGVMKIVRINGRVTGYIDGTEIWSTERNAPLTRLQFVLQNNGTNDPISVTFKNWKFTASPASVMKPAAPGFAGVWRRSEGGRVADKITIVAKGDIYELTFQASEDGPVVLHGAGRVKGKTLVADTWSFLSKPRAKGLVVTMELSGENALSYLSTNLDGSEPWRGEFLRR